MANLGKRFAVRYVGTVLSGKNLTLSETNRLRSAGLDLVAVYQTTAGFMFEGADGYRAAQTADQDARSCGMPAGRPIYFALDRDPASLTASQWMATARFLDRAALAIGRHRVGVYGGYEAIERLVPHDAAYGWQTYAWSRGRINSRAHLYQYRNGVDLCGGLVDLCRSLAPDYGQWTYAPAQPAPSPPTEPEEPDMQGTIVHVTDDTGAAHPDWHGAWLHASGHYWSWIRTPLAAAVLVLTGQATRRPDGAPHSMTADVIEQTWRLAPDTDDPRTLDTDESLDFDVRDVNDLIRQIVAAVEAGL